MKNEKVTTEKQDETVKPAESAAQREERLALEKRQKDEADAKAQRERDEAKAQKR